MFITASPLVNGHSSVRKCGKNHVKQTFNQRNLVQIWRRKFTLPGKFKMILSTLYFQCFLDQTNQRNFQLPAAATSFKVSSTALFKSTIYQHCSLPNLAILIGTQVVADIGPKQAQVFRVILLVSVGQSAKMKSKSTTKQETHREAL